MTKQKIAVSEQHASRTIRINTFQGAYNHVPLGQDDVNWSELCDRLEGLTRRTAARDKRKLPAFTLGTLAEPYNINANYLNHTALVIDVDRAPQEQIEVIAASGLNAFVYASPSDPNPDGSRRLRVVVELSEPLAPEDVKRARLALAEHLGIGPGQGVETAIAVRQTMFAGRMSGAPVRETWRFEGEPLDVPTLLARPLQAKWRADRKPGAVAPLERLAVADPDERTEALLEALRPHWADGEVTNRRQVLRGLGGYLARRGWPDEQIAAVAQGLAPDRPVTNRVALAVECARAARLDDNAAGWSSLAEWSPDAAAVIESVAKDPREPDGFVGVWVPSFAKMFSRAAAARERASNDNDPLRDAGAPAAGTREGFQLGKRHSFADAEEPIDYLCKGLCLAASDGKISLIAGEPGGGKGPIANHLAVSFALGLKAFGEHECKRANVLLLDCEGARLTMRRLRRLVRGAGHKAAELDGTLHVYDASSGNLTADEYFEALRAYVAEHSIGVLVLDSYTSAMLATGIDANQMQFAQLAKALGALGILVLAVAHSNKAAAARGGDPRLSDVAHSGALAAMAQTAIVVSYPDPNDRHTVRIACARAPESGFAAFAVRFSDRVNDALTVTAVAQEAAQAARAEAFAVEHAETVGRRADAIERILARDDSGGRGIGVTALKQEAGLNGTTWPEARDECLRRGSINQVTGYKSGSIAWIYIPPDRRPPPESLGAKLQRERARRDKGTEGQRV